MLLAWVYQLEGSGFWSMIRGVGLRVKGDRGRPAVIVEEHDDDNRRASS